MKRGGQIDPSPEKTTLKKSSLIRVKAGVHANIYETKNSRMD